MQQSAVEVSDVSSGVVQITMQDRDSKNTFSPALAVGLIEAFARVSENEAYKAVVLTGYDRYFASGGTQAGLLSLHEGHGNFAAVNLYSLALECPVPVISAMQGHGIGGGFVMGLFADFVVLGRENVYTTNFMKYGFTPGMGATLIVPAKLGLALGHEMLMTANTYRGADLERRGVPFRVIPHAQVLGVARELAVDLAQKPRNSLVLLKNHLAAGLRRELPTVIEQEIEMHEATFHSAETRDRIIALFGA